MANRKIDVNPFNSIASILFLVLIFVGLFFVAKGVFWILSWLAPVFLILTLIIDYKVVVSYGTWLVNLLKKNILMGLGAVLLTVFGFPVVSGFLFGKAIISKKIKEKLGQFEQPTQKKEEFVSYEEVEDDIIVEEPLDLDNVPRRIEKPEIIIKENKSQSGNEYDNLFE